MGSVLPKVKMFIFISMISLMINLSIVVVAFGMSDTTDLNTGVDDSEIEYGNNINVTALDVVVASGTSFLPFVDLLNIATLELTEVPLLLVFYALITGILGALKLYLLIVVVLNMLPLMNV